MMAMRQLLRATGFECLVQVSGQCQSVFASVCVLVLIRGSQ